MIRPKFSIRGVLFVFVIVALSLGIQTTNKKIEDVDPRIAFAKKVQAEAWANRDWQPETDDPSLQFGPRYGITPGTLWRDQDAWYEREYWIHVPADGSYQLELVMFDWRDGTKGPATQRFFADLPFGTSVLRWDLRHSMVNKYIKIWVNDRSLLGLTVPNTEGVFLAHGLHYAVPEVDTVHRSTGPSKTQLRVAGECVDPPQKPMSDFLKRNLFEIRLGPKLSSAILERCPQSPTSAASDAVVVFGRIRL